MKKSKKDFPINYYFLEKVDSFLIKNHRNILSKKYNSNNFHIHLFYKTISPKF